MIRSPSRIRTSRRNCRRHQPCHPSTLLQHSPLQSLQCCWASSCSECAAYDNNDDEDDDDGDDLMICWCGVFGWSDVEISTTTTIMPNHDDDDGDEDGDYGENSEGEQRSGRRMMFHRSAMATLHLSTTYHLRVITAAALHNIHTLIHAYTTLQYYNTPETPDRNSISGYVLCLVLCCACVQPAPGCVACLRTAGMRFRIVHGSMKMANFCRMCVCMCVFNMYYCASWSGKTLESWILTDTHGIDTTLRTHFHLYRQLICIDNER